MDKYGGDAKLRMMVPIYTFIIIYEYKNIKINKKEITNFTLKQYLT
jgi:hypothetical protein